VCETEGEREKEREFLHSCYLEVNDLWHLIKIFMRYTFFGWT
jgi:hypothetical protein